jgi:hypothetical protein
VSRADAQRFTEILHRLRFKEALAPGDRQVSGIQDYYGYDHQADKLVHVHAHYQLIIGHDMSKNYHLTVEGPYLASAVQCDLFKVPAPEFELILFTIRMVLKHSTWDAVLSRQGTLSATERQELAYLETQANRVKVYEVLKQHLPCVDAMLFDACLQSLRPECAIRTRIRTGQRLQSKLKAHARRSQISDLFLKLWRRVVRAVQRRVFTVIVELYAWLSTHFETIKIHMGKPSWSWTTIVVRGILKIGRSLGLYPFMRAPFQYTADTHSVIFPGYPWLLREVCTARDRYLTYARARRFASNGGLVICDRFPLPQVMLMDGPQSKRMTSTCKTNWLIKFLTRLEVEYYQQIMLPELLIVLRVDPETAVQRKTDEDEVSVRARSTEIWELDWRRIPAHVIDANLSKEEVLSKLKALVWSEI